MAKTSWLQVTGQTPRPFKTKKAAGKAFTLELERLMADGWVKYWGTMASGRLVLMKLGAGSTQVVSGESPVTPLGGVVGSTPIPGPAPMYLALVISTVDANGYDLDGNRIRQELRS